MMPCVSDWLGQELKMNRQSRQSRCDDWKREFNVRPELAIADWLRVQSEAWRPEDGFFGREPARAWVVLS